MPVFSFGLPRLFPATFWGKSPACPDTSATRNDDHARITDIRNTVKENILRDPSRVTVEGYNWFRDNPGVWVWEDDGVILGFYRAAGWKVIGTSPRGELIFHSNISGQQQI